MSLKSTKSSVRYSDLQKQEVVDFVVKHNSIKQRGGVAEAVKRFKISPITINAWIKAAAASPAKKAAPAAKKAAPATKKGAPAAKKSAKGRTGVRYSDERKKEVVDFVLAYNAKHGRGGQSRAAKKFKLTALTVSSWLKDAGARGGVGSIASRKEASAVRELAALKAALRKLLA